MFKDDAVVLVRCTFLVRFRSRRIRPTPVSKSVRSFQRRSFRSDEYRPPDHFMHLSFVFQTSSRHRFGSLTSSINRRLVPGSHDFERKESRACHSCPARYSIPSGDSREPVGNPVRHRKWLFRLYVIDDSGFHNSSPCNRFGLLFTAQLQFFAERYTCPASWWTSNLTGRCLTIIP